MHNISAVFSVQFKLGINQHSRTTTWKSQNTMLPSYFALLIQTFLFSSFSLLTDAHYDFPVQIFEYNLKIWSAASTMDTVASRPAWKIQIPYIAHWKSRFPSRRWWGTSRVHFHRQRVPCQPQTHVQQAHDIVAITIHTHSITMVTAVMR